MFELVIKSLKDWQLFHSSFNTDYTHTLNVSKTIISRINVDQVLWSRIWHHQGAREETMGHLKFDETLLILAGNPVK